MSEASALRQAPALPDIPHPDTDPFTLLGIPAAFNVDFAVLEQHFLDQQLRWHPDRWTGNPQAQEKAQAVFARLVAAEQQLKDRAARAQALLRLRGHWPVTQETHSIAAIFELEEEGDSGATNTAYQKAFADMQAAFAAHNWSQAGRAFAHWQALKRLLQAHNQEVTE